MPPNERAMVLLVNGDTGTAEPMFLNQPGTNLEDVDPDWQPDTESEKLATVFMEW
jgi:hypothetical protein